MPDTESTVRGFIEEMWGTGNTDLVNTYVHQDYLVDGQPGGRDFVRRNMRRFRVGFPDYTVRVLAIVVDGDQAAVLFRLEGTHLGEFGGMAPTGRAASLLESGFFRVQEGEVISADWVSDSLGLRIQLGYLGEDFWSNPRAISSDEEISRRT